MTGPDERNRPDDVAPPHFSFARLALTSLGAGVAVLVVGVPIIVLVTQWSPTVGLIVALVVVIGMIVAIGAVSRRIVAGAERDILAYQAAQESLRDEIAEHRPGGPHRRRDDHAGSDEPHN